MYSTLDWCCSTHRDEGRIPTPTPPFHSRPAQLPTSRSGEPVVQLSQQRGPFHTEPEVGERGAEVPERRLSFLQEFIPCLSAFFPSSHTFEIFFESQLQQPGNQPEEMSSVGGE
ncbi:hypothetical protein R6Z07F_013666 [Ovis aries]